jgi:hypothetical protein
MTSNGEDFCTAGKGVSPQHCGCIEPPRLSECAVAAAELIDKCAQLPLEDPTVGCFVRYAGLETAVVEGGDVCACYEKYKNGPNDSNREKLCSTLWEHVQPDKERPDSATAGGVLVIIDFQQYVVLVNRQEYDCRITEVMIPLKKFIDMYQEYFTRTDVSKLLDRLIAVTDDEC